MTRLWKKRNGLFFFLFIEPGNSCENLAFYDIVSIKFEFSLQIEKVEDPKALFEKAQAFVKSKLSEVQDGKKD